MKEMVESKYLSIWMILVLLLSGCGKEDDFAITGGGEQPVRLGIQVCADAFHSSSITRTEDTDAGTGFSDGDELGVIITHADGSIEHVVYTFDGSYWTAAVPAYYASGDRYDAYYPFREDLLGKSLDEIKSLFVPLADQSNHDTGYAASDLMTCTGASMDADHQLQINLTHEFSLLRMQVSGKDVQLRCADGVTYTISATASDVAFRCNDRSCHPWIDNDGYARLIVKNGTSGTFSSAFTLVKERFASPGISLPALAAGCYHTVSVTLPSGSYNLGDYGLANMRIGDFYMKSADGNTGFVFPREVSALPDALAGRCIGVVCKVGRDNAGTWVDNCSYKLKDGSTPMTAVNGYVLALRDADDGNAVAWCSDSNINLDNLAISNYDNYGTNKSPGFFGYDDLNIIKKYAKDNGKELETYFPAVYWTSAGYEATCPAPSNTSGWFLPSANQFLCWADSKDLLLSSIKKTPSNVNARWWNEYWTSSKDSNSSSSNPRVIYFSSSGGYLSGISPSYDFGIYSRAVLVF